MRLAGHLRMTLEDILTKMSSREFSYWREYDKYYEPIGGEWDRAGLMAAASLAPYCPRGRTPKPKDFIPTLKPPQHPIQIQGQLELLKRDLEEQKRKRESEGK